MAVAGWKTTRIETAANAIILGMVNSATAIALGVRACGKCYERQSQGAA